MPDQKITIESASEDEQKTPTGAVVWELVRVIIVAFVVMVVFRVFVAEPFVVSGSSMVPNFHNKEYLIVDKVSYRFNDPARGDVIIFRFPKDDSQYFIKRVIGLPGEKVQVENGSVKIFNAQYPEGRIISEAYLPNDNSTLGKNDLVSLGKNEFYVLGDNRLASSDSRYWGVLPKHDIIGKSWMRVFPISNFGWPKFPLPEFN